MSGVEANRPGWTRWRWRARGALTWPLFAVCLVADIVVLHLLPIDGDSTSLADAFVVAGFLNLVVVAVLGPLAGAVLRRRRPDLPRVVARDYAGAALLVGMAALLLVLGLCNRPAVQDAARSFRAQEQAARLYVVGQATPEYVRNIDRADTVQLDPHVYRTCVPGADPQRALCLFIDTSRNPPGVRRDPSTETNLQFFNHRPPGSGFGG